MYFYVYMYWYIYKYMHVLYLSMFSCGKHLNPNNSFKFSTFITINIDHFR